MSCGILGRGFAHLLCESCGEHHVVAFSCKARAVCPSCLALRIFTDTVSSWYRRRQLARSLRDGETGAVTAIQRANSDLRLSPHFHTLFLDGVYGPDRDGKGRMFLPAPAPSQEEVEWLVEKVSKRVLRFLQRRGAITLVIPPGDGEVTVVTDESLAEKDPLLAKLLAAATAGAAPAGPANQRKPIRIVLDPDERPVGKGGLCAGRAMGYVYAPHSGLT
jgi:hypothetical protein